MPLFPQFIWNHYNCISLHQYYDGPNPLYYSCHYSLKFAIVYFAIIKILYRCEIDCTAKFVCGGVDIIKIIYSEFLQPPLFGVRFLLGFTWNISIKQKNAIITI